jgi:hypothetical protein
MSGFSYLFNKPKISVLENARASNWFAFFSSEENATVMSGLVQNAWTIITGSYTEIADAKGWFAVSDATSGELTYSGPDNQKTEIACVVDFETATNQTTVEIHLRQNDSIVSASFMVAEGIVIELNSTTNYPLTLNDGDVLQYYVRNIENAGNITIRNHSILFTGLGG